MGVYRHGGIRSLMIFRVEPPHRIGSSGTSTLLRFKSSLQIIKLPQLSIWILWISIPARPLLPLANRSITLNLRFEISINLLSKANLINFIPFLQILITNFCGFSCSLLIQLLVYLPNLMEGRFTTTWLMKVEM